MRRAGRISLITPLVIVAIAMLVIVLLFSRESISVTGGRFMDALARSDVDGLTALSVVDNESPSEIKKKWEFATQIAAKTYSFRWRITSETSPTKDDPTDAVVNLEVERNFGSGASYEEHFALPMVNVNGTWKVNVAGISREMYPGLPKA